MHILSTVVFTTFSVHSKVEIVIFLFIQWEHNIRIIYLF